MKAIPLPTVALAAFAATLAARVSAVELPYRNEATRELLVKALDDRDRVQRIRAAGALAAAQDPRNGAALARVAEKDPAAALREQAGPAAVAAPLAGFSARPAPPPAAFNFSNPDPRPRQLARLKALREDPAYARDFRPLLEDPDYFIRRAVSAEAVGLRGAAAAPLWRELLASTNNDLRVEAAWAAGQLRDAPSEAPLIECLGAPSERLRLIAIASLATLGGDATRAALPAALGRAEGRTREEMVRLAMALKALPALPALRALAADKAMPHPARNLALDALAALGDASAKETVLAVLRNFSPDTSSLREHAAGACATLGFPEALPVLRRLACDRAINIPLVGPSYDNDSTRIAAIAAIARLGGLEAMKPVAAHACLEEAGEDLRKAVADAMTGLTGTPHGWRRAVSFRTWFMQALGPEEMPADLAANQKMPPVFAAPPATP